MKSEGIKSDLETYIGNLNDTFNFINDYGLSANNFICCSRHNNNGITGEINPLDSPQCWGSETNNKNKEIDLKLHMEKPQHTLPVMVI